MGFYNGQSSTWDLARKQVSRWLIMEHDYFVCTVSQKSTDLMTLEGMTICSAFLMIKMLCSLATLGRSETLRLSMNRSCTPVLQHLLLFLQPRHLCISELFLCTLVALGEFRARGRTTRSPEAQHLMRSRCNCPGFGEHHRCALPISLEPKLPGRRLQALQSVLVCFMSGFTVPLPSRTLSYYLFSVCLFLEICCIYPG